MGSKALVVYDDFHGGEWGNLGPKLAAKNQFHGSNVLVYADGQVGPRSGLLLHAGTKSPGQPLAFGRVPGDPFVWWQFEDTVGNRWGKRIKFTDITVGEVAGGNLAAVGTTRGQSWDESDGKESYAAAAGGIYKQDHAANTLTLLAGSPAARALVRYGDRLVSGNGPILRYSAPGNFNSWPVQNSITVGESGIRGLYVMRGQLVIVKNDYSIWLLTGVPGVNEFLREVQPRPDGFHDTFDFGAADVERLARAWMATPGTLSPSHVVPSLFAGSVPRDETTHEIDSFRNNPASFVDVWNATGQARSLVAALHKQDSVVILTANGKGTPNCLIRHNGVWTEHTVNLRRVPNDRDNHALFMAHTGYGAVAIVAENIDFNPLSWDLFVWQAVVDEVPIDGGTAAPHTFPSAGYDNIVRSSEGGVDSIPCSLELSEFWMPDGQEFTVREVHVDISARNITNGTLPTLTCNLTRVGRSSGSAASTGGTGTPGPLAASTAAGLDSVSATDIWQRGDTEFSTDLAHLTVRFTFDIGSGRGMQLKFPDIRACSIRRVTVYGDTDSPRA